MAGIPQDDSTLSPGEEQEEQAARSRGCPYLIYRDHHERRIVLSLEDTWDRVTVGRSHDMDLVLHWDNKVSTVHAELARLGQDWALVDEGLSRNGSFVNGQRVESRRRLLDGDQLRLGSTEITYRFPFQIGQETVTALPEDLNADPEQWRPEH